MCVEFGVLFYFWGASPPIQILISVYLGCLNFILGRRHLIPPAHKGQILHPNSGSSSKFRFFIPQNHRVGRKMTWLLSIFFPQQTDGCGIKKCGWRWAPGCGPGGEAPASFCKRSPHCAVFLARFFCSVTGEAKGTRRDETRRDECYSLSSP
jgi:hypothetical protein